MDKKILRREISAKKRSLTEEQIERYSQELLELLVQHPLYKNAKSIYGYLSYNQEVRTEPILRRAQADGKKVAVPKVFGDEMKFLWLEWDKVEKGYKGIPEPAGGEIADDPAALMLMPGLAFDHRGHRLGYGGGFYDKFLASEPHPTLALCYNFQLLDHLETESHDIPVDAVLSSSKEKE